MGEKDQSTPGKRQYPPLYERVIPIALGVIVVVIIVLLFVIVGIALGLFPNAG
jgi:hypothetical protein